MADIFGRSITWGGSFQPEGTTVSFAGAEIGAIIRSVQISYGQAISRLWDLGTGKSFIVAGNTNGTWSIGTVAGVGGTFSDFGEICAPGEMVISADAGMCGPTTPVSFTLRQTILAQVGLSVVSDDMIINEAVSGLFLSLEVNEELIS